MRRLVVLLFVFGLAGAFLPVAHGSVPEGRKTRPAEVRLLREAADVTLAAGPRKYTIELLIDVDEDPPNPDRTIQTFTAEGVVDPATGATVATFGVADAEFPDDATANTLEVVAPSSAVTYVASDDAFELPAGKRYVEVPTDQLGSTFSATSSLRYLSSFVGKPRFRGTGEVGEAKTKTFVVDIPIRTILVAGGIPSTPAIEKELRRLEKSGRGNAIGNVEIDGEGRIYFFATYLSLDTKGRVELTINGQYSEYGVTLDATPPPADQFVTFDQAPAELVALLGLDS